MRRKWPVLIIAILVGYATACRAVGVALLPVLLVHTSRRFATSINRSDRIRAAAKVAFTMLVGAWGIIAMLCFHCWQYGNPIAFASVQSNWYLRPLPSLLPHALNLLSGVPLRDVYNSNSPAFWANFEYISDPIFSLQFSNPLYVSLSIFLVIFGTWKSGSQFEETILSFGLIFIPYILHSYQDGNDGTRPLRSVRISYISNSRSHCITMATDFGFVPLMFWHGNVCSLQCVICRMVSYDIDVRSNEFR